jgi:hypothetical protein
MSVFCKNCNRELKEDERPCSACGEKGRKYVMVCEPASFKVTLGAQKWKHKRPGVGTIMEGTSRPFKKSADPKLAEGVSEVYWVDKIKKVWNQVVRDLKTGEITHEEHQSLAEKNKKLIEK